MQRFFIHTLLCICSLALLNACGGNSSDEPTPPEPTPPSPGSSAHRTVLVYMVSDNNLGSDYHLFEDDYYTFSQKDLAEMQEGVKDGALNGGHLIVYQNRPGTANGNPPQLIEISPEGQKVIKTYPDDPSIYSVEIGRMRQVLADVKSLAPADEYGLIFWGHATAWMTHPEDMDSPVKTRSYGTDRNKWMSLSSLATALDGEHFSFIYFDCCLMGTVEIAYEFRDLTPVIAASPTELEGEGMPYHLNVPEFFEKDKADIIGAATNTYNYLSGKGLKSQMVVIDTSKLPALAESSRELFKTLTAYPEDLYAVQALSTFFNWSDPVFSNTRPVYDMENYMQLIGRDQPELLADWQEDFDSCILYKATTSRDFTGIAIRTYGGLGSFVIRKPEEISYRGYNLTSWWTDVVSAAPLYN